MTQGALELLAITNPLATSAQLATSGSQLDGVPASLETSAIHLGSRLTQIAGILLRLPQDLIAQAIVIFTRFWVGPDGGSLREHSVKDVSAAALYLVAKPSAHAMTPRSIVNVFAYVQSLKSLFFVADDLDVNVPESYHVTEGTYFSERAQLVRTESAILRVLGFELHVVLPHAFSINYLQTLDVFHQALGQDVAKRTFAHLNSALLSPQFLYLTHQPPALATAAIYLAAREVGIRLPLQEWWEVFDTDREELGFLVVAMLSMEAFVKQEVEIWAGRTLPLSLEAMEQAIKKLADDTQA